MSAVAGLAGFSVTNVVRQDAVIAAHVEKLPWAEKHACKLRGQELHSVSSSAMQKQHGICNLAIRVVCRGSKGRIMKSQLRQRFARFEMEIVGNVVALFGSGQLARLLRRKRSETKQGGYKRGISRSSISMHVRTSFLGRVSRDVKGDAVSGGRVHVSRGQFPTYRAYRLRATPVSVVPLMIR